jgi:hypothetical protein
VSRSSNKLKILCGSLLFALVLEGLVFAQDYIPRTDTGIIQEIIGDRIYVQGKLGAYIFEMINTCSWCERQADVAVVFESFSRASMHPYPNPLDMGSVQLFIVKDARDNL